MIFLSDQELADELGLTLKEWESKAAILEKDGLPKRDALFGYKRCWPAVLEFFVKRAGGSANINTALPVKEGGRYRGIKKAERPKGASQENKPQRGCATVLDLQQARSRIGIQADVGSGSSD